jgi:hypothetical protein
MFRLVRVMVAILIGFAVGVLLFGSGVEWVMQRMAGDCWATDCSHWRTTAYVIAAAAWIAAGRAAYVLMERFRPEKPPSEFEDRLRRLRRRDP